MRKSMLLISGVGIGAGLLYALTRGRNQNAQQTSETADNGNIEAGASMRPLSDGQNDMEPVIDNLGTDQHQASEILKTIRDAAFDSDDEKLALALGRPVEEIQAWTSGDGAVEDAIDGDVVMKARHLADMRGVEIQ